MITKLYKTPLPPIFGVLVLMGIAVLTLVCVFVFEHFLGVIPCSLCLRERYPFYILLVLCGSGLFVPDTFRIKILFLAGLVLVAGALLGIYHIGVEEKLWLGPADCSGGNVTFPVSPADLLAQMKRTRVINCSEPNFFIFGLSLAFWNTLLSIGGACLTFFLYKNGKNFIQNETLES